MTQNTNEKSMECNNISKLGEESCKLELEESIPELSTAVKGASEKQQQSDF